MGLKKIRHQVRKWGKRFLLGVVFWTSLNALSIPVTYFVNKNIEPENKTLVFTSGYNYNSIPQSLLVGVIDFFMYTPITLKQNLKGNQVDWNSNLPEHKILEKLLDEQYQNIVFIGHGNKAYYCVRDGGISVSDLIRLRIPKRDGEFLQHTCGGGRGMSLRNTLLNNPDKGYSFDGVIGPIKNYATALIKLFEK